MDKIYLKDNYIVTEIGGIIAVFPKNYSGYSENASGFYINSTFPVNNQRTIFIAFSDVGSIYDEAGVTAYTTDTLRTFLLSYTGFKSPSGGSGGIWGSITGTLSSQTDLQTALDAKQDDLISGTNIKTINSTSLLGSGDVAVQPTLVSGTNIRTINGNSLLGSGDITVGGGITVGTTPVTSGTNGRIFFQAGGVVQQDSVLLFDNTNKTLTNNGKGAVSTNTSFGIGVFQNGTGLGTQNTAFGWGSANYLTSGSNNTFVGHRAGGGVLASNFTGNSNTLIGNGAGLFLSSGSQNTFVGGNAGTSVTTGGFNTIIGHYTGSLPATLAQNVIISDGANQVALWMNSSQRVGFGYNPLTQTLGAKVDILAQGALSTDIAFRVRNSADNTDLFRHQGNGEWIYRNNGGNNFVLWNAVGLFQIGTSFSHNCSIQTTLNNSSISTTSNRMVIGSSSHNLDIFKDGNFQFEEASGVVQTSGRGAISLKNAAVIPSANTGDRFMFYSADIIAGNAAPHFRTENGDIIRLFTGAALTASDGTLANAVTRIAELEARLKAAGLIA